MKKTLATILRERTETIEFRSIRKQLMTVAQNGKFEMRRLQITAPTIVMLQNNGIAVEKIKEDGYEVYKLTW